MRIALTSALVLFAACPAPSTPAPQAPQRPVVPVAVQPAAVKPADPAEMPKLRLPKTFAPSGYTATLAIDPARDGFDGVIAITGEVKEKTPVIWLHGKDLTIKKASSTTGAITITPRGEDLLEVRGDFAPGALQLDIEYSGKLDTLNTAGAFKQTVNGTPYVFTQFEALYARRVFPCVDEPDTKVPWQLTLDVPKKVIAVSNTPVVKESDVAAGHRYEFAKTKPLPSYLIAFGIGPFDIVDAGKTKNGVPVRIITMKGRGAEAAYAAKNAGRVLELLEDYFGMPYPYEKLDLMTIPIVLGFSAMENAGLVTFTEQLVLFDPKKPSWRQRQGFIGVASHELAHQWFGDYVTTAWWDDIWLNEGFATWLGRKIVARFEPAWHEELGELDTRMGALDADSVVTARKVRQPIEKLDDVYNAFDGITYVKGAAVLNTFEQYVGPDVFQKGIREYLKARAFGNATSENFVAAISAASGKDLAPAFATYLDQPGAPELETKLTCDKSGAKLDVTQQRFVPPGSPEPAAQPPWIMPVCVAYDRDGKRADTCTLITKQTDSIALEGKKCPRWVMPTAHGRGYYRVRYTAPQATKLRDEAWPLLTWTERRAVFFDVVSATRYRPRGVRKPMPKTPSAKLPLTLMLSLVPKLLAGGDRFTVGDALIVPAGMDRFVPDEQRAKYESWMRATFGPGAAKLGLTPQDNDDVDAEANRTELVRAVAWFGRDPDLVKQDVDLAANWRDLPTATRGLVLAIAVDASPDLHGKILRDVKTEQEHLRRDEMYAALAGVRDPKRVEAALELLLDPKVDIRESQWMLLGASTEATRKVMERFVRVNKDKLLARLPNDSVTGMIGFVATLFSGSCDETVRDETKRYVLANFGKLPGGERVVNQSFEAMDQCIASRKVLEPELRAFLSGVKIPKPAPAKPAPAKPAKP
ncbi:MAG TPA: M1 family aminopeptidase [Kofleriaceae bacterium]|nr:M1 family aminopeptidase [Kofleriaceae bacterium]